MTKFAFNCRMTVQTTVLVDAETEVEAWEIALGQTVDPSEINENLEVVDNPIINRPIFRRIPDRDEYDL